MSVSDGLGQTNTTARKPSGVLIFLPLLIAVLGAAALFLGQLSAVQISSSGYGIDERTTGAIAPVGAAAPIINLDR
ncbi:MAG: hypothetical protein ACTSWI_02235 [Alphaproteobacteria bacterium]